MEQRTDRTRRNGAQIPGGWVYAQVGVPEVRFRSVRMPSRYWAEFPPGDLPYRVVIDVEVIDAHPTIVRLIVEPAASGEVSGSGLRSIPLARLLARATQGAPATLSRRVGTTIVQPRRPSDDEVDAVATGRTGRRTPWKLTDEFLTEVADIYRTAEALSRAPVIAVADEKGRPRNTARRWVVEARARGLLEPTNPKGS